MGRSAIGHVACSRGIDTVLPSLVFRAGETINGNITLAPQTDMSNGELGIYWGRNISHPLVRTPAIAGGTKSGQTIKLGKGITVCSGTTGDGAVCPMMRRRRARRCTHHSCGFSRPL
jgi:hypothetical protein